MTGPQLSPELPWLLFREDDRRFRYILCLSLLCSLAMGAIAPYIPVPERSTAAPTELPARRVRLLEAPVRAEPRVSQLVSRPARPDPEAAPKPIAETRAARPPVSGTGILALGTALSRLQNRSPRTVTERKQIEAGDGEVESRPSLLTEDLTDLGGTVKLSVSREEMLGTTDLPDGPTGPLVGSKSASNPQAGAPVSAESTSLRTEGDIQAVLDRHKGEVFTLYNRALRDDPDLQGKLLIRISIDAAGRVTSCSILNSELGATELEQELVALVKGIRFGSVPGAGVVTTRIPIEFFPQ